MVPVNGQQGNWGKAKGSPRVPVTSKKLQKGSEMLLSHLRKALMYSFPYLEQF